MDSGAQWSSSGYLGAATDSTLVLGGTWSNTGQIGASFGTLDLGSSGADFALDEGTNYAIDPSSTVNIIGTLTSDLDLSTAGGSWYLDGGTIQGGLITTGSNTTLYVTPAGGTLDGATLQGNVEIGPSAGATLAVVDGLTLNNSATITIDVSDAVSGDTLVFSGVQTVNGSGGSIVFGSDLGNKLIVTGGTTTFGPNVTIDGYSGTILTQGTGAFVNEGTIASDLGGTIAVDPGASWSSSGHLEATESTLRLGGTWTNTGLIDANDATLYLGSTGVAFTLAAGTTYNIDSSRAVVVVGDLQNQGQTLALCPNTGSWYVIGSIVGGTVSTTGGTELLGGPVGAPPACSTALPWPGSSI